MKISLIETVPYKDVFKLVKFPDPCTEARKDELVISFAMISPLILDPIFDRYAKLLRQLEAINIEVEYIGITSDKKDFSYGVELIFRNDAVTEEQLALPEEERDVTREESLITILDAEGLKYVKEGKA